MGGAARAAASMGPVTKKRSLRTELRVAREGWGTIDAWDGLRSPSVTSRRCRETRNPATLARARRGPACSEQSPPRAAVARTGRPTRKLRPPPSGRYRPPRSCVSARSTATSPTSSHASPAYGCSRTAGSRWRTAPLPRSASSTPTDRSAPSQAAPETGRASSGWISDLSYRPPGHAVRLRRRAGPSDRSAHRRHARRFHGHLPGGRRPGRALPGPPGGRRSRPGVDSPGGGSGLGAIHTRPDGRGALRAGRRDRRHPRRGGRDAAIRARTGALLGDLPRTGPG